MNTKQPNKLERVCFTICIVTVCLSTLLAFGLIWTDLRSEFIWKSLASMLVLFGGSVATLSVSKSLGHGTERQGCPSTEPQ